MSPSFDRSVRYCKCAECHHRLSLADQYENASLAIDNEIINALAQ